MKKNDDPVVSEVRRVRKAIAARCGNDKHRLLEWARQVESAHKQRVIRYDRPAVKSA